jgi:rubrerythrin
MDLEEAINTAINYETKVRDVYSDAEAKATNTIGKKIFNVLSKEEQRHLDYLEVKLKEWQTEGKVTPEELETYIPSQETIEDEITKLKTTVDPEKTDKKYSDIELQMLKKALEVEQETSEFYHRMVSELSGSGQELFRPFLEIEEGHKLIVQAEIDSVTGIGYWFDIPEFNLASK